MLLPQCRPLWRDPDERWGALVRLRDHRECPPDPGRGFRLLEPIEAHIREAFGSIVLLRLATVELDIATFDTDGKCDDGFITSLQYGIDSAAFLAMSIAAVPLRTAELISSEQFRQFRHNKRNAGRSIL